KAGMCPSPSLKSVPVADSMLVVGCAANLNTERPQGTEGWGEEALQKLVTRDSMIGLCPATPPPLQK
ncbi:MAG: nitrile hydratase subunit alpha, partial [Promethearchaeia archaeon]